MNEEQQRLWSLLQDALPNVATQMRGSLSNLYTAVGGFCRRRSLSSSRS